MASESDVNDFLRRIRLGDSAAADELISLYRDEVCRHIATLLRNSHRATPSSKQGGRIAFNSQVESVFNTVLVRLLERVKTGQLEGRESLNLVAYLNASARNELETRRRHEARRKTQSGDEQTDSVPSPQPLPDEVAEERELLNKCQELMEHISKQCRDIVTMRCEGKSFSEIAHVLGREEPTLRATYAKCLRRLRILANERLVDRG